MDGNHTIQESYNISVKVLTAVYAELISHHVDLECTLLKPNMVRTGVSSNETTDFNKIAKLTVKALQQAVPVSVPGIVFLSGGMSEVEASIALNNINNVNSVKPWYLTFSYGRALQASVLQEWKGNDNNIDRAQKALLLRAHANSLASIGKYQTEEDLVQLMEFYKPDIRILGDDYIGKRFTGDHLPIKVIYTTRSHNWSTTKIKDLITKQTIKQNPEILKNLESND